MSRRIGNPAFKHPLKPGAAKRGREEALLLQPRQHLPCLPGRSFRVLRITASRLGHLPWKILTSRQEIRASAKPGGAKPALTLLGSNSLIDLHHSWSVCPGCRRIN